MQNFIRVLTLLLLTFSITNTGLAQSVIDDIDNSSPFEDIEDELFEERIVKISPSKRVFVLTNENNGYNKGDFISLILEDKLVCRSIVAKMSEGVSGIKERETFQRVP